jgi:hypothetical protein
MTEEKRIVNFMRQYFRLRREGLRKEMQRFELFRAQFYSEDLENARRRRAWLDCCLQISEEITEVSRVGEEVEVFTVRTNKKGDHWPFRYRVGDRCSRWVIEDVHESCASCRGSRKRQGCPVCSATGWCVLGDKRNGSLTPWGISVASQFPPPW